MKKFLTFIVAALFAASASAQNLTPLSLGGGWNGGFVTDADVYDYTSIKQWGEIKFPCNVSSADYSKFILELESALPANCATYYTYKESADASESTDCNFSASESNPNKYEITFDANHPYIASVSIKNTGEAQCSIKVKKLTLVSKDGKTEKKIIPEVASWAATDNTVAYKCMVAFNAQYQQLNIKGVENKSNLTVKVSLAEAYPDVQVKVEYEDNVDADYIGFNNGKETIFDTKKDVKIKSMGIQYTAVSGNLSAKIEGAWLVIYDQVKMATKGYATYAASYPVNYSDCGLTAYAVKLDASGKSVTFKEIDGTAPANTAVLLKGEANTDYTLKTGDNPVSVDTDLKVSDGNVTSSSTEKVYGLATVNGQEGFYLAKGGAKIPAKCGCLQVSSTDAQAAFYSLGDISGATTGIEYVEDCPMKAHTQLYNLAGQAVSKNYKGIVIKNGKKMIQK